MTRFSVLYRLGLAALAVAVVAMAANAQPPGRRGGGPRGGFQGGPGGGGMLGLLMNEQVRDELDLTEDQMGKLRQAGEKMREGFGGGGFDREAFQNMTEEQRQAEIEKRRAEFEKRRQEMEKRINDVLEDILVPEQLKRLEQISLQQQRTGALGNQKVINALGITPEQQARLRAIGEKAREQTMALFQGMGRDSTEEQRNQAREKGAVIRAAAEKEAMGVLTAAQKEKLKELMGEPFELQRPEGGAPGGGFQGRGGPGQQQGGRGPGQRGGGRGGDEERPARPQA